MHFRFVFFPPAKHFVSQLFSSNVIATDNIAAHPPIILTDQHPLFWSLTSQLFPTHKKAYYNTGGMGPWLLSGGYSSLLISSFPPFGTFRPRISHLETQNLPSGNSLFTDKEELRILVGNIWQYRSADEWYRNIWKEQICKE